MSEIPEAQTIVLKKRSPLAPPFHRHIAKSKLRGTMCKAGDRIVVYDIVSTEPSGIVQVTEETVLDFEE